MHKLYKYYLCLNETCSSKLSHLNEKQCTSTFRYIKIHINIRYTIIKQVQALKKHIEVFLTKSPLWINIFFKRGFITLVLFQKTEEEKKHFIVTNKELKYFCAFTEDPVRLIRELCIFPLHQKVAASYSLKVRKLSLLINKLSCQSLSQNCSYLTKML